MAKKTRRSERTKRLRVLRAEHGLSQMEVAERSKIAIYRYWSIENGYGAPASETERASIAKVLKAAPEEVFPEAVAS